MDEQKYLYEEIDSAKKYGAPIPNIPEYITENLRNSFWQWQTEALENFLIFEGIKEKEESNNPTHLMFNMATGTGKTMIMAALILYYYKKGYKNFIFFVNQNNIVDKTENNFINKNHIKYLFKQNIVVDDKNIDIRMVDTFDNTDDIQIKFTSIHKLHNSVYLARENSVTLDDLQKKDLVMIGDEAHNFNATTKKKSNGQEKLSLDFELKENASEADVERSWEDTIINKILKRGKNTQELENKNVLLEFTATIPRNSGVIEKYRTKTIYKFELVDFLKAGYTKEINLISTSLKKKEKILLSLLFNWYRHQIALKNNIHNFKPVILFRSKFIEESKKDYEFFTSIVNDLITTDLNFLVQIENSIKQDQTNSSKIYEQGKSRIVQILKFIKDENINKSEIVSFIKDEFKEKNCIITNSKDNKATTKERTNEEQEQLLNSLEDINNHIRAIFTVKRLTEGWDVLNLFDIVRLYEGRDEGHQDNQRIAGQTTIQEIQLIGRGVRYFPFTYNEYERNKRKFDNELENPLRVLEEFYYHSDDDHRYLDELKRELKNKGFISDNREIKKFALKDEFKQNPFFKDVKIWKNEKIDNPKKRKITLSELEKDLIVEYKTRNFRIYEQQVVLDRQSDETLTESKQLENKTIVVKISDFEKHIFNKAINIKASKDLSLLRFERLQKELNINSIEEILTNNFIGNFKINIITPGEINDIDDIDNEEKLEILLDFFDKFTKKLGEIANPYKGTEFKPKTFDELFGNVKEKLINLAEYDTSLENEAPKKEWFVLNRFIGTYEETKFFKFFEKIVGNLKTKYPEIYLLRNEEVYLIYDYEQGRGFAPDFLLFLKSEKENIYYQVFIEPKGKTFIEQDGWKEIFLDQIDKKHGIKATLIAENKDYKLVGLPFYNSELEVEFNEVFDKKLLS